MQIPLEQLAYAKPLVILHALLEGRDVEIDGQTYRLNASRELCALVKGPTGTIEPVVMPCPLSAFLSMCDRTSAPDVLWTSALRVIGGMF